MNSTTSMSKVKKMFVIPIHIFFNDSKAEMMGLDEEDQTEIVNLMTTHVDAYWIEPQGDFDPKYRDLIFYVDGQEFISPYSEELIRDVIHPAMHTRAANEEDHQEIISPN